MTYIVNIDGVEIKAGTPAEVLALTREYKKGRQIEIAPKRTTPDMFNGDVDAEAIKLSYAFLKAIVKATQEGEEGASADDLMKALGITQPKALGGRTVKVRNFLAKIGFNPDEIYSNPRVVGEERVWIAGPTNKILEAMEALQKRLT